MNKYAQEYAEKFEQWKHTTEQTAQIFQQTSVGFLSLVNAAKREQSELMQSSGSPTVCVDNLKQACRMAESAATLAKSAQEHWENVFGLLEILDEIHEAKKLDASEISKPSEQSAD